MLRELALQVRQFPCSAHFRIDLLYLRHAFAAVHVDPFFFSIAGITGPRLGCSLLNHSIKPSCLSSPLLPSSHPEAFTTQIFI
jgi:hypothetical protein